MINDKIEPMGFDITKNLHGHVRVETRDRWTGRVVDSQEKDNLVTNVLQDVIQACAYETRRMSDTTTPLYAKALGGLLLFNGALTESASNTHFPSNVKLVGCAGQSANTSDALGGSYNAAESVLTSNGFTTTWDFLTSQANGTIASLARTSKYFAVNPGITFYSSNQQLLDFSTGSADTFYAVHCLGYDETNKYLYVTPSSNTTIGGVAYTTSGIYRVVKDFSKVTMENALPPASQMTLIKTLTSSDGYQYADYFFYDKYANNFIYWTSGTTLHIVAMDGTHSTKTITGTSGSNGVVATENYYWKGDASTLYRISKSNVSDVQAYSAPNSKSYYLVACENDIIFAWDTNDAHQYLWYPDGTCLTLRGDTIGSSSIGRANAGELTNAICAFQGSNYLNRNNHYLGTIANLDSPVTKTSSQTMKITYTLTEA